MEKERTFQEIINITNKVIEEFSKVQQRPWGAEAWMIELMKQVGDLSKRIMSFEKYYLEGRDKDPQYKAVKEDIEDELADIIFSVIGIANHYKINLENACIEARRNEMKSFGKKPDF